MSFDDGVEEENVGVGGVGEEARGVRGSAEGDEMSQYLV